MVYHWSRSPPNLVKWLASKSQGFACFHSLSSGFISRLIMPHFSCRFWTLYSGSVCAKQAIYWQHYFPRLWLLALFFKFYLFLFYMYRGLNFSTPCACSDSKDHNRALDTLKLELKIVLSCHLGGRNQELSLDPLQQQPPLISEPPLQPQWTIRHSQLIPQPWNSESIL